MGKRANFSKEKIDGICDEYLSGTDAVALAEKYGVSSTMIYNWLKARHLGRRPGGYSTPMELQDQAATLYQQGEGSTSIARQLGISDEAVLNVLKRRGIPIRPRDRKECLIENCDAPASGRGLCNSHYSMWYRRGTTERHEPAKRWLNGFGYVVIELPDGRRTTEHRYVMEQTLGRPLLDSEIVHHLNHDKTDNRPENLRVMTRAEHNKEHRSRAKHSREQADKACQDYLAGAKVVDLAEAYDVTPTTIYHWLKQRDIQERPGSLAIPLAIQDRALELKRLGRTEKEVISELGISRSAYYRILRKRR